MRAFLVVLRFRLERKVALWPWRRTGAAAVIGAGAVALVISGLLTIDYPLRAIPGFVSGGLMVLFGAVLWHLE